MKPFFISLPRTRSSILYHLMKPYATKVLGLLPLNHNEFFLDWSNVKRFVDKSSNESHKMELYPLSTNDSLDVHYIYPHVFTTTEERNLNKLKILQQEKDQSREYYIKGTLQVLKTLPEVLDFFSDRKFIITKRRDIDELILSYLFACQVNIFHVDGKNIDAYSDILYDGITIDKNLIENVIPQLINQISQAENIEGILKSKGYSYDVVYYEDINNQQNMFRTIDTLFGTNDWREFGINIPTFDIDKDYTQLIHNYENIKDIIINERNKVRL